MRIGIDLTFLTEAGKYQGSYTYVLGLLNGFKKLRNIKFQIYVSNSVPSGFINKFEKDKNFKIIFVKKKKNILNFFFNT